MMKPTTRGRRPAGGVVRNQETGDDDMPSRIIDCAAAPLTTIRNLSSLDRRACEARSRHIGCEVAVGCAERAVQTENRAAKRAAAPARRMIAEGVSTVSSIGAIA